MVKIENTIISKSALVNAVYSARNAMNSWNLSDSNITDGILGEKDLTLALKLVKAGSDHSKFMRMINVQYDITAPMYFYSEFDTYKVATVRNSCSKMHKLCAKEFELSDFSFDNYDDENMNMMNSVISSLNINREKYLETKDKKYWYYIIQLLPESYNQKSTISMNYATLRNIYFARKNHKLTEWHQFCEWVETLPYSELITCTK